MIGVQLCLFCTNECGSSRAMMPVGNIETWHLGKLSRNCSNILIVAYHPELMTKTVDRSYEIIFGCSRSIAHQYLVENSVIGISKEYGFDISIAYTHMLHAVFLLVATSKFMLLDNTCKIIIHVGTNDQTILCLAVHSLRIDIILFLVVLLQPAVFLKLLEIFSSTFIDARIIL